MEELGTHGFDPDPLPWLKEQIDSGKIKKYSDEDIINELATLFGKYAHESYYDFLKAGCDAFDPSFFETYYRRITDLPNDVEAAEFLDTLRSCDAEIPNGSSMGEKKSFVLAQTMQMKHPGKVVVFCSDDSRARQRLTYVGGGLRGFSILAAFQKMMKDGVEKSVAKQYYDSLCSFYSLRDQKSMKVWKYSTSERISVDFEKIFEDIYAGKFEIKLTGDLRYNCDRE